MALNCKYYDEGEIERDFPLSHCGSCANNQQDSEDGVYMCRLMLTRVEKKGTQKNED